MGSCLLVPLLDITSHASLCVVKHSVVLKTSWAVGSIAYDTLNYVFSTAVWGEERVPRVDVLALYIVKLLSRSCELCMQRAAFV